MRVECQCAFIAYQSFTPDKRFCCMSKALDVAQVVATLKVSSASAADMHTAIAHVTKLACHAVNTKLADIVILLL